MKGRVPWNKGLTKYNNESVAKISETMSKRPSNFASHYEKKRKEIIKLTKNKELSYLIGIILGDGGLEKFPRTERLQISFNSKDLQFANKANELMSIVFKKEPSMRETKKEHCIKLSLYQNKLSDRLEIPCGNKIKNQTSIPYWVTKNNIYIVSCLKGLFETDGCFCVDNKHYTYIIEFKNYNSYLLNDVFKMIKILGFNPQLGSNYVRLARKKEVDKFIKLISFRDWHIN